MQVPRVSSVAVMSVALISSTFNSPFPFGQQVFIVHFPLMVVTVSKEV